MTETGLMETTQPEVIRDHFAEMSVRPLHNMGLTYCLLNISIAKLTEVGYFWLSLFRRFSSVVAPHDSYPRFRPLYSGSVAARAGRGTCPRDQRCGFDSGDIV